jgi:hypothetical protein
MDAMDLIDTVWPDHTCTSCSDENITNGFRSCGIDNLNGGLLANGRCLRCMLLEMEAGVCADGQEIPGDGPNHLREDW